MFCPQCGGENTRGSRFCTSCGVHLEASAKPVGVQTSTGSIAPRFAGFWLRAFALIIDVVLCQITAFIVALPFAFAIGLSMAGTSTMHDVEAAAEGFGFVLGVVIQWLWFTIPESSAWQASLGKKVVGIKVTDENGGRIGFGRANGRYWSKILSALIVGIGYLMAAFTENKQALHDKIAGTLVIRGNG